MGGIDEESRGRVISRDENENGSREIVVDGGGWFKTGRERSSGQISSRPAPVGIYQGRQRGSGRADLTQTAR